MPVYDEFKEAARELIELFGEEVILRGVRQGAPPNSNQPWKAGANEISDEPVTIAFVPDKRERREFQRHKRDGMDVPTGFEVGIMAPVEFEPRLVDKIVRGSLIYDIKEIKEVRPNGESATLHILRLKR